jgi:DNA repair exonuclease SbcCD nuclease subunit
LNGVERVVLEPLGLCLSGRSYSKRCTEENLFAEFPAPIPSLVNLGLLHTSADGAKTGDHYAPCGRRELIGRGYEYLALGHVHEPEIVVNKRTTVAYSGCLQGRNFTESGARGCLLVDVEKHRVASVIHHPLDVVRFGRIDVDVSAARSFDDVLSRVNARCKASLEHEFARALVVRFCLKGGQGLERLLSCSTKLRSSGLRDATESLSDRLSVDGFWARPDTPEAPHLRLDDDQYVRRVDF